MNNFLIEIQLKFGRIKLGINNESPPRGTCKNCGQEIFWIKMLGRAKLQASHLSGNKYIDHSLCCPTVLKYEQNKMKSNYKKSKKY